MKILLLMDQCDERGTSDTTIASWQWFKPRHGIRSAWGIQSVFLGLVHARLDSVMVFY